MGGILCIINKCNGKYKLGDRELTINLLSNVQDNFINTAGKVLRKTRIQRKHEVKSSKSTKKKKVQ